MFTNLRKILALLFICCAQVIAAQSISVSSFKLLENDLTANTAGTTERDQNGEVAALIKVVTTEQGFVFDGGMVGVVKTKQGVGEIWVYVPHGIKKITIQHPQLGVLRDYFFPIAIEKAKTYEMKLTTGTVQTIVNQAVNKQFVVFEITPPNATVELNDEYLGIDEEGHAEKNVPFGKYTYRISAHNYHTEAGVVEVNNPTEKHVVKINLRPNFGWLEIPDADDMNGADIYINNEKIGRAPFKSGALKSATYKLRIVKSLYKPYEGEIKIEDNKVLLLDVKLTPNFAPTTLVATEDAEIYIDGERKGIGTWIGPLEKGSYTVEVRKKGHLSTSIVVHVTTDEARSIQLPNPIPILSAIEITSTPSNAIVVMDGKELGTTPILLPNLLVGEHELSFSKKKYQTATRTVEVKENETAKLHVELSGECSIKITTIPSGAKVAIGEEYCGVTPIDKNLYAGTYTLRISKQGYNPIEETIDVDGMQDLYSFVLKRRYIYPQATYIGAGVSAINTLCAYGAIGFFNHNVNAELGYLYGLQSSEAIYWNGKESYFERYYTPRIVTAKLGYGITCGNRVRITPQMGCSIATLHESGADDEHEIILDDASLISGVISMRCDVMLGQHFGLNIAPQYLLTIWSSPWATTLRDVSPAIDKYGNGFSIQAGFSLYF